jgi:transposase InsO family protein
LEGWTLAAAAEAAGVSVRTISKWLCRYQEEGEQGLLDRSSAPRSVPARTDEERLALIAALRRLRKIAETLAMPRSTVSGILTRIGLGRLSRLEPPEPPNRYQRRRAGELIHVDVKKLGRIRGGAGHRVTGNRRRQGSSDHSARTVGWEYVHIAIDDATRLVYVEILADEKAVTAAGFLRRAVAFFRGFGIRVERVMTDNGSAYVSTLHALVCKALGIRHLCTRPYRPRTNGKVKSLGRAVSPLRECCWARVTAS